MNPAFWLALAAASPLLAQAASPAADPSDAAASAPRMSYRSVFPAAPRGVASSVAPWRQSNAEVARFPRGHIDLLRAEPPEGAPASTATPAAVPAAPVRPAAPAHQH